jgi:ribosomal protein S27AE
MERNGKYICERLGGHLAGQKPKDHLKKANPYAAEGKKQCSKCGGVFLIDLFDIRRASWDGRSSKCKKCASDENAARYLQKKAARQTP